MLLKPSETVLVLDLDDTLYAEYDYKQSGIAAVIDIVYRLYPEINRESLLARIRPESAHWLDDLCNYCGFNESEKQTLLWHYRLHRPSIAPFIPAAQLADWLTRFAAVALISDGRSLTQRLKLEALGLLNVFHDILISEASGADKPNPQRFEQLQQQYAQHATQWVYVGDNLKKDFITPNRLGWHTVGIKPSEHNIHRHDAAQFSPQHQPHIWLDSVAQLPTLFSA